MKKLRNNSGTALIWTVMVLGMLMIFSTTVLTMAMAYSKRTLNQNQNQQAYYTALSAVNIVAEQFVGVYDPEDPQYENQQKIIDKLATTPGTPIEVKDFDLPPEMGTVKVTMSMGMPTPVTGSDISFGDITITAEAEKNGESYRLSAVLKSTKVEPEEPETPAGRSRRSFRMSNIISSGNDYGNTGTIGIGASSITGGIGMGTNETTDIYVWDNIKPFELDCTGDSNDAIHMGALYTKAPVLVKCQQFFPKYTHLHGEIISENDITITGTSTVGLLPGVLLPVGRVTCCNNVDPSFIHTTGTVTMSGPSRMGGNITANKVVLSGESIVVGNITANTVTIDGNSQVLGNIVAKEIIIKPYQSSESKIVGNVSAVTVTMSGGAYIEGIVTADTLSMSEAAHVHSANSMAVTVNKFIPNGNQYSITGTLSYFEASSTIIDTIEAVKLTSAPPPFILPTALNPLTSQLPNPPPAPPPIPPIPTSPQPIVINESGDIRVGNANADSYYIVNGNLTIYKLIAQGNKNIFIYIPGGYNVTVKRLIGSTQKIPNLFFILGDKKGSEVSKLSLGEEGWESDGNHEKATTIPAYVWSTAGSGAQLTMFKGTSITGGVWVDNVINNGNNGYNWSSPEVTDPDPTDPDPPDPPDPPDSSDPDSSEPDPPDPPDSSDTSTPGEPEEPEKIIIEWTLDSYANR